MAGGNEELVDDEDLDDEDLDDEDDEDDEDRVDDEDDEDRVDDEDDEDRVDVDDDDDETGYVEQETLTGEVEPVDGLGRVVTIFLGLNVLSALAEIGAYVSQLGLLRDLDAGVYVDDAALTRNDQLVQMVALSSLGLLIVTAIAFVAWMHRAYGNLTAFAYGPAHGKGWTIGAWIVPILNLFRPFQMMREIHSVSAPDRRLGEPIDQEGTPVMAAWWGTWIVVNLVGRFEARMSVDTIPQLRSATQVSLGSCALTAVCALLAAVVVHQATARQTALIQRLGGGPKPTTF